MKKFIAGVVVGFMLSCAGVFAAPSFDHNGTYWNQLNASAKAGYVNGYSDAMQVSVGKLNILTTAASLFHWKGADKIIHQLSHELAMSEQKPEEAVKRLDELYSDRKYAELDLGTALQLLAIRSPAAADKSAPAPAAASK
ncbi:MAG TPA: hypothetical protein VFB33_07685 [Candidatus Binataceae bacterium]|jgi:hypothetical protein|nr:hypothetical protein [Candidatus Binataceae bacterium]